STTKVTNVSIPSDADVSAASPTRLVDDSTTDDITLAETLMKIKSSASRSQKDKGVMFKEPTQRVQAELDEEARLEREREEEANYELATKLQEQEREELIIEERSKLFVELMNERKKHFASLGVEEQRRKPPTKTQKRNLISTYLKSMAGYKHTQLKNKSFEEIQMLFEKEMKRVNIFVDMDAEFVKGSETQESEVDRVVPELAAGSSKRDAEE
ncbi:hypothetical protein Tco_1288446, partial [Tanacetum coccineum]